MSTLEEVKRQLRELQELSKEQNERLRREKEEAEARAAGAETRAEKERREKEEAEARAAGAEARAAGAETRAHALERRQTQTQFTDYIRSVENYIFATFSIEPDPKKNSSHTATSVEGKFYPQRFQPWADFATVHNATFANLATTFSDSAYFPALTHVESLGQDLSPKVANEFGVQPFVRAAIEKPAAKVVSKYLEITGHKKFEGIKFKNNSYGISLDGEITRNRIAEDLPEPARKRRSPVKDIGIPDRWLVGYYSDGKIEPLLVGDIKPAHVFHGSKLSRVLSAPRNDFFLQATRRSRGSSSDQVPGEVYVAKAICQVFHYMITSGLEFGYVATGDGLVFLRVLEDDPNTLYYFASVFPVHQSASVAAIREPRETAMAHLATLCVLSVGSTRRSRSWIDARDDDLQRWPNSKANVLSLAETPLFMLPHDRGGGAGGAGGVNGAGSTSGTGDRESKSSTRSTSKRPRSQESNSSMALSRMIKANGTQKSGTIKSSIVEAPTLPYCTQACLLGLCRGSALDRNCPNARLHEAGAHGKHGHALTADEVRSSVVAQLAKNMDRDCKCFFFDGDYGRHGVLFKITVTGFGYTFVAKAVLAEDRYILQHEVGIYTALGNFQGRLIPVCLGLIDLERSIPLGNCQYVSYMMLMSYAGPDMHDRKVVVGVDLDLEAGETCKELYAAGLRNNDVHIANLAWNEEVHRVMGFDFDDAYMEASAVAEPRLERSPLQTKRDLNVYNESAKWSGDDQMKKRARAAT